MPLLNVYFNSWRSGAPASPAIDFAGQAEGDGAAAEQVAEELPVEEDPEGLDTAAEDEESGICPFSILSGLVAIAGVVWTGRRRLN